MAVFGFDAFSPPEIAERVATVGVAKARLPLRSMVMLSILAGAFIGLGALYYVIVASDPSLGFAQARVLGGLVFSLGLVLVVLAGAELFTGNNLLVMAWLDGRIRAVEMLRNWGVVFLGNLLGAAGLAGLVYLSGHAGMNGGLVGQKVVSLASQKLALAPGEAFVRGILCNVLVCMAVWLAMAGRTVVDRLLAVVFPISAFVAAGFEHCVANMYLIPLAILLDGGAHPGLDWLGFARSQLPVIAGNLVGGVVLVGGAYSLIYGRRRQG